jgi:hypothetical protein
MPQGLQKAQGSRQTEVRENQAETGPDERCPTNFGDGRLKAWPVEGEALLGLLRSPSGFSHAEIARLAISAEIFEPGGIENDLAFV